MIKEEERLLFRILEQKTGVTEGEIFSRNRKSHIIDAKRIAAIILRKHSNYKLWRIAELIGLDHSSICHYQKTHDNLIDTDRKFREDFDYVKNQFLASIGQPEITLKMRLKERELLDMEIERLKFIIDFKKNNSIV